MCRHSRSLRQLTVDNALDWKEELEAKFLKSEFWHQPYEYAATGCGQEQIEKTMKGPLPIFRLRLPEEARPIWPAIKSWLDTLPMFDKIITPYYKPSARESQKAVITQTESPVEAVKSYLNSLQDDFAKTNRARIQEEAERIMQEARVVYSGPDIARDNRFPLLQGLPPAGFFIIPCGINNRDERRRQICDP